MSSIKPIRPFRWGTSAWGTKNCCTGGELFAWGLIATAILFATGSRAAFAQTPAAKKTKRPNVLFIAIDDLNNHLGAYGHPVQTPNIDRLAARGVRFDRAYCQYPLCNPSRTSLLSGKRPRTTGVDDNNTSPRTNLGDAPFLPEHFRANGYTTVRGGKISHNTFEDSVVWDVSESAVLFSPESVSHFEALWNDGDKDAFRKDFVFNLILKKYVKDAARNNASPSREGHIVPGWPDQKIFWYVGTTHYQALESNGDEEPDHQTAMQLVKVIEESQDKPFFIGAGFYRPHLPWVAPKEYFDRHPVAQIKLPFSEPNDRKDIPAIAIPPLSLLGSNPQTDAEAKNAIQAYHASISFVDTQVGLLIDALDRSNQADKTIIVLFGDHGYHLGEHGGFWHKVSLFEESARVPLIVVAPGKKQGVASDRLVELVDIYPTLTELAGIPAPPGLDGESFAPLLNDPSLSWKKAAFTEVLRQGQGDVRGRSVRTDRFRYTEWGNGQKAELYDHLVDPNEQTNLARDPSFATERAELHEVIRTHWPEQPSPTGTFVTRTAAK